MEKTDAVYGCKNCTKTYKTKGGLINHEKKCAPKPPVLENTLERSPTSIERPNEKEESKPSMDTSDQKQYAENELIILKASDFDRMITEYLKIFIEHYNTQMSKLMDENRELITYNNTLAEILKSIVCSKKAAVST
jgi:hypothetical protein